ncbi:hypothetical protein [Paenibacillus turpanensis]|uniref:hypothetical protein n=1 Tax=Paenibacillus turpanensis TaxID=2689078 RepID=UPI00140D940B|nr:hypothetical protein [Paenibacillus turpanensis]
MKFLLRHHAELNLPYPFAVKLSFLSSPLLFGKAMLILSEEDYDLVGAVGFVYGTGANAYEDRHICQVEVFYLRPEHRRQTLFVQVLLALLVRIKEGCKEVERVQFWVKEDQAEGNRLFSKCILLPGSERHFVNDLVCYQIPFRELENYCLRFQKRYSMDA